MPKQKLVPDFFDHFLNDYQEELSDEALYCIRHFLEELYLAFADKVYANLIRYDQKKEEIEQYIEKLQNDSDSRIQSNSFDDEF